MLLSVFTVGDIDFRNTVFSKPISQLSIRLFISIAKKQELLMNFGDTTFDTICNVIPFCDHFTAPP